MAVNNGVESRIVGGEESYGGGVRGGGGRG